MRSMPDGPNPGQSYEAWIESKAGASPPEPDLQAVVEHLEAIPPLNVCFFVSECEQEPCRRDGVGGNPCQRCLTTWAAVDALAILAGGGVFRGSARNEPT